MRKLNEPEIREQYQIEITNRFAALENLNDDEEDMWNVWVGRGGCVGKPEVKNHRGDLGVDGWIILGWISRRWDVGIWTGLGWPRIETSGGRL